MATTKKLIPAIFFIYNFALPINKKDTFPGKRVFLFFIKTLSAALPMVSKADKAQY